MLSVFWCVSAHKGVQPRFDPGLELIQPLWGSSIGELKIAWLCCHSWKLNWLENIFAYYSPICQISCICRFFKTNPFLCVFLWYDRCRVCDKIYLHLCARKWVEGSVSTLHTIITYNYYLFYYRAFIGTPVQVESRHKNCSVPAVSQNNLFPRISPD